MYHLNPPLFQKFDNRIKKKMGLFKQFVYFFDSFSSPATLRASGSADTASLCTGFFSFMLVAFFGYIFAIKSYEVMTYQQVQSNSVVEDKITNQKTGKIMFAMNIFEEHGMLVQNRYFQFYAAVVTAQNSTNYPLRLCKLSDFSGVDEKVLKQYYDIEQWLCPESQLELSGVKSDSNHTTINLKMDYCLFQTWCAPRAEIVSYIQETKRAGGYLTAEILIKDTSFTLTEQTPTISTSKYIVGTFTQTAGIVLQIGLAEYQIQTDINMLPWNDYKIDKGVYVYTSDHYYSQYDADYNYLVEVDISFKSKTHKASRAFGKLDDMLSYAGGLFGIIAGFFVFFLGSYNEYRYELQMAEGCFNLDEEGNKVKSQDFHFIHYMGYVIFDWFKTLTCHELKWKKMKEIDETREEAVSQMDVFFLYKKIQYLENLCKYQMTEQEAICLSITQPPCLDVVRTKRMFLEYYDQIIKGEASKTLEDIYPKNAENMTPEQRLQQLKALTLPQLTDVIMNYKSNNLVEFENIEEQQLDEDFIKVQEQLATAFYELSQEKRGQIQGRYPLVILYCLIRSKTMNEGREKTVKMDSQKDYKQDMIIKSNKVAPLDSSHEIIIKNTLFTPND